MPARFRFAVLVLILCACGDSSPQEPMVAEPEAPASPSETETSAPPTETQAPVPDHEASTNTAPEEEALDDPEAPTLPTKMGRRLSNHLRQLIGARVALPRVLNETLASGGNRVMGVMSFSENEACVGRHEDRAEGRAACREELDCIQYGTVLAEFAPPRPRTPEGHGGALTVVSPKAISELNLVCAESIEVQQLEVVDIDGDGEPELVYDAIFHSEHDAFRGGGTYNTSRRFLRVIRMNGTEQVSVPLSTWGGDSEATETQYARRVRFEPQGGGLANPALLLEEVAYESIGGDSCPSDDAFFATDYQNLDESMCVGESVTITRPYNAECDCWPVAGESDTVEAIEAEGVQAVEAEPVEAAAAPPTLIAPSE